MWGLKEELIWIFKTLIGRPLQWYLCLLHFIELPLRHLLKEVNGGTSGPYTFSGPIGKLLANCEEEKNSGGFKTNIIWTSLNCEWSQLWPKVFLSNMPSCYNRELWQNLSAKKPGKLAHARWLTTAFSLLRLYISMPNPSKELQILTKFVVQLYAPVWFNIKRKPLVKDGATHLFMTIKLLRYICKKTTRL